MPRRAEGYPERHGDHWDARLGLPGRPRVCLPASVTTKEAAKARAVSLTRTALANHLAKTDGEPAAPDETVSAYAGRWLDAREADGLHSVKDDRGRLKNHVLGLIGEASMRAIDDAQLRAVVASLDKKERTGALSWKTAANVWGLVTKMFADARSSKTDALRVRADNPCEHIEGPDRGDEKARAYLYPSELSALLACDAVLLHWRRIFALAVYTYARAGELEALSWSDVDLAHGVLHFHSAADRETAEVRRTKTGVTRRVPIEPTLRPLLEAMRKEAGGVGRVIPKMPSRELGAITLRKGLERAGITRAELFADDETRTPVTFHDLRATGISWCAVRGDEPLKLQRRAGHKSLSTTQRYIREAENVRDGFGVVFAPLPACLLGATGTVAGTSPTGGETPKETPKKERGPGTANDSEPLSGDPNGIRKLLSDPLVTSPLLGRGESGPSGEPTATIGEHPTTGLGVSLGASPRSALASALTTALGAALVSGDLGAARIAHEALAKLLAPDGAADPAPVVDLATRRGSR